jgi:hypothetical protein
MILFIFIMLLLVLPVTLYFLWYYTDRKVRQTEGRKLKNFPGKKKKKKKKKIMKKITIQKIINLVKIFLPLL